MTIKNNSLRNSDCAGCRYCMLRSACVRSGHACTVPHQNAVGLLQDIVYDRRRRDRSAAASSYPRARLRRSPTYGVAHHG
jgi:hypothetical protein